MNFFKYSNIQDNCAMLSKAFCERFGHSWPTGGGSPASLAGLVAGDDTGGMLRHVCGHQAPRTRPGMAARRPSGLSPPLRPLATALDTDGACQPPG